jgi:electron transfer flavoprotein beta subunit
MRIVVPVKFVPDIQSDRRFGADGRVARTAADGTLNELDENAIEAALRLVEALDPAAQEASEVVVVTVGPAEADLALRKAYQLGAHRGVRVSDEALAGSDYFATAAVLAAAVRSLGDVDLVVTGMAALDGLGSVVPTLLAADLGWPQLLLARRLDVADGVASVTRELDGVTEELTASLPAVVSVTDHVNTPRYPNFALIMAARTKEIEERTLADLGVDPATVGEAGARSRVLSAAPRPPRDPAVVHVDKGEGGLALAAYLIDNRLV